MSLLEYSSQPVITENRLIELSRLFSTRTTEQIKDCLADQDIQYLVALCNKAVALDIMKCAGHR